MPKPKTNIDFVRELMDFSRFGALAQMFVIDALSKWSAKIAETPIEELRAAFENTPLINAEAWHRAWHARSRTSWMPTSLNSADVTLFGAFLCAAQTHIACIPHHL